jgi:hypothetical protein
MRKSCVRSQGGLRSHTRDRTRREGERQRAIQGIESIVYVRRVCPSSTVYYCLCWCLLSMSVSLLFFSYNDPPLFLHVPCSFSILCLSSVRLSCVQSLSVVRPVTVRSDVTILPSNTQESKHRLTASAVTLCTGTLPVA